MKKKHIVSFSGGKDSTAMLLIMIEKGYKIDEIIFVDTTKEFPDMYKHICQVEKAIFPLTITRLSFDYDYYLSDYVKTKGKNKGKRGYGFPDFRNRWCTAMKRDIIKRYLNGKYRGQEIVNYIGIAYDERNRIKKNNDGRNVVLPLVGWQMTENNCMDYCITMGYWWNGLYEKFNRVSCWCCPMSRIGELKVLHDEYPELWTELRVMGEKAYNTFRPGGITVEKLNGRFERGVMS